MLYNVFMHSIRAKSIILNLASLVTAITVIAIISSVSVANFGHESAEQSLMLQCEKGKNSLNYYFKSAEQSLNSVSGLIDADLSDISDSDFNTEFHNHVERSKIVFGKIGNRFYNSSVDAFVRLLNFFFAFLHFSNCL